MIVKQGSKWILKSEDGKKTLGKYDSKKEALEREKQIKMFKHMKK